MHLLSRASATTACHTQAKGVWDEWDVSHRTFRDTVMFMVKVGPWGRGPQGGASDLTLPELIVWVGVSEKGRRLMVKAQPTAVLSVGSEMASLHVGGGVGGTSMVSRSSCESIRVGMNHSALSLSCLRALVPAGQRAVRPGPRDRPQDGRPHRHRAAPGLLRQGEPLFSPQCPHPSVHSLMHLELRGAGFGSTHKCEDERLLCSYTSCSSLWDRDTPGSTDWPPTHFPACPQACQLFHFFRTRDLLNQWASFNKTVRFPDTLFLFTGESQVA